MSSIYHVSAFTEGGKGGNLAGVVLGADNVPEKDMLSVAAKLSYSETAFVSRSSVATYKVRFFTPTEEVPLCGHATIATWSLLFQLKQITSGNYTQETGAGILQVEVAEKGFVFMQQAELKLLNQIKPDMVSKILGIKPNDIISQPSPQIVSTGLPDLIVGVKSNQILLSMKPDFKGMSDFSKENNITGVHAFAPGDESITARVRNFAPLVGIDEEAATGTANGALLSYMNHYGLVDKQDLYTVIQGESMNQPSKILGKFIDNRAWIGGEASIVKI